MKKLSLLVCVFVSLGCFVSAAGIAAQEAAPAGGALEQLDAEIAKMGNEVARKLAAFPQGSRVRVGSFLLMGAESPFGFYMQNELLNALAQQTGTTYTVQDTAAGVSGGRISHIISGEALRLGSILRVYVRLSDTATASVSTVWHTDLRLTVLLEELISATRSNSSSSAAVIADDYESDSMDEPVSIELDTAISRTIHQGDTDWFVYTATANARLVFETSGRLDTVMELYDGESRSKLADDDDSGEGSNARIIWSVIEGRRYIIKVGGYDSGDIGPYSFRVQRE